MLEASGLRLWSPAGRQVEGRGVCRVAISLEGRVTADSPSHGRPRALPSFLHSPDAGFEFFEASAKDNINVKQTFERLVDVICEKMSESLDTADPAVTGAKQGPQLTDQQAPPHQDCAC